MRRILIGMLVVGVGVRAWRRRRRTALAIEPVPGDEPRLATGPPPDVAPGRWLLWGSGEPTPATMFDAELADDRAATLIAEQDPDWASLQDGWSLVVSAEENEILAWAERHGTLRGGMLYQDNAPGPKLERARPY